MNYDKVPKAFRWMLTTSFFHAAYEALLVNELRYLQLIEHKVRHVSSLDRCEPPFNTDRISSGLIFRYHPLLVRQIPHSPLYVSEPFSHAFLVLSSFGFHAQAFWWPDAALLAIVFGIFIVLSYLVLELFVKERR